MSQSWKYSLWTKLNRSKEVVWSGWSRVVIRMPTTHMNLGVTWADLTVGDPSTAFLQKRHALARKVDGCEQNQHPKCSSQTPKLFSQWFWEWHIAHRMRAEFLLANPNCQVHILHVSLQCLSTENTYLSQTTFWYGSGGVLADIYVMSFLTILGIMNWVFCRRPILKQSKHGISS